MNATDRKRSILIVDDQDTNARLYRDLIERVIGDVTVRCCFDGDQAIRDLKENAYDLVLLDIQLPSADGWQILRKIREGPQASVPVICITAFATMSERDEYVSKGFDDLIAKPLTIHAIIESIRKHLHGGR